MSKKLFVGPKLRRLRLQHQLSQAQCATRLELSHSYLNQLENNQRPVTASVLIKLSNVFGIDIGQFSDEGDDQLASDISQALKDPALADTAIQWQDIQQMVQQQPELAGSFSQLYGHYSRLREDYEQLVHRFYGEQNKAPLMPFPYEEVQDFFYQHNNYIEVLDRSAENLFIQQHFDIRQLYDQLQQYLLQQLGITVVVEKVATDQSSDLIKQYNANTKTLHLSGLLKHSQQCFQMATQIAQVAYKTDLDNLCKSYPFSGDQAQQLAWIGLSNYFAGALLMPYGLFLNAAEQYRYDIETLQSLFYVSTEQACHRLSTLQRRQQRGVPFYFVRVDQAGNISKRQSATSFHFARTGGACPLWNVHEAFSSPQQLLTQVAQMPDGQLYFSIATQVTHTSGSHNTRSKRFAVGLGCELEHAHRLVYADGVDLQSASVVTPIGASCRVCPRQNCTQRAFPPAGQSLKIDNNVQLTVPYGFDERVKKS